MTITIPEPMEWPLWLCIVLLILPLYLPGFLVARWVMWRSGWTREYVTTKRYSWETPGGCDECERRARAMLFATLTFGLSPLLMVVLAMWGCLWPIGRSIWLVVPK